MVPAGTGRWLALQVASHAVRVVLAATFGAGTLMGIFAYLQKLPLAYGFLAVIIAMAAALVILNQSRAFLMAYGIKDKFHTGEMFVYASVFGPNKQEGYTIGLTFKNTADVPIEYRVTRERADLNGMVAVSEPLSSGAVVEPNGGEKRHSVGVVLLAPLKSQFPIGELDVDYEFGKPGKLNHEGRVRTKLLLTTDKDGAVVAMNAAVIE